MITIPIWLLVLLIILALGGISITFKTVEPKKRQDPYEPVYRVTPDAQYQSYEILGNRVNSFNRGWDYVDSFNRGWESHRMLFEVKDTSLDDYFRMVCVDEEKQIYLPAHQVQQMAYEYFMRTTLGTDAPVRFIIPHNKPVTFEHTKWVEEGE